MHFPQNQLLMYKLFLSYPDKKFYMHEIGRIINKKPGVFQRTLNKIEEDGFVNSEFIANARFFQLNKSYPILKEIESIVKKLSGEINIFKEQIKNLNLKKTKRKNENKSKNNKISLKNDRKHGKIILDHAVSSKLSDIREEKILTSLQPELSVPEKEESDMEIELPARSVETTGIGEDMETSDIIRSKKTAGKEKDNKQLELF